MNTRPSNLVVLFAALFLSACDQQSALKRFTTPEHDQLARGFLSAVRLGDSVTIWKALSPPVQQVPAVMDSLRAATSVLPQGSIDTLRQVGAHKARWDDVDRSLLTYELHTANGWGLVDVGVVEEIGLRYVESFRTAALPASLEATNSFGRGAKSATSLAVLLAALCCAVLSLGVAARVARTRIPRRWLWALFALVGVGPLALNWTTGQVMFQLIGVQLLSAGIVRTGPASPWLVTVAFPVGAIAALERLRRAKNNKPPEIKSSQLGEAAAS